MPVSPYRPRNPGHDYYGRGVYLVTLVVSGRQPLLSSFAAEFGCKESLFPTPLGEAVLQAWQQTPAIQASHGNRVEVHAAVCMPDHFHGVIEVLEPMPWSLGDIVQAFKATCTARWQAMQGLPSSSNRPISVDCQHPDAPAWLREKALVHHSEGALVRSLSHRQRQEYYALVGRSQRPLFDDNYDDTVCLDERHRWLSAILAGQTVIVTPGISRGEQLMKNECLAKGYPLIHLQDQPIGPYWKPERSRFDACANGSLLILAPWDLDAMGDVAGVPADSSYSRFHNLNTLAKEICSFDGEARILRD